MTLHMKRTGKPRLHIKLDPPAALLFLGLLWRDPDHTLPTVLLAAAIHEVGHLTAARLLHIPIRCLRLDLLGARLETGSRLLSYGEEWLLCAAGPLFSLLAAIPPLLLLPASPAAVRFSTVSLALGVFNLLPIGSFDGGRMLEATLSPLLGQQRTAALMTAVGFAFLFFLWCLSVYCLLRVGDGLSMLCFCMSLFCSFWKRQARDFVDRE